MKNIKTILFDWAKSGFPVEYMGIERYLHQVKKRENGEFIALLLDIPLDSIGKSNRAIPTVTMFEVPLKDIEPILPKKQAPSDLVA